jgi:hypothetical protein
MLLTCLSSVPSSEAQGIWFGYSGFLGLMGRVLVYLVLLVLVLPLWWAGAGGMG